MTEEEQRVVCPDCDGFGYLDEDGDEECPTCEGDGTVDAESL